MGEQAKAAILEVLRRAPNRARFVPELIASAPGGLNHDELNQAIADLEQDRTILMREHYCDDPHVAGVDLRIVAPLLAGSDDPEGQALHAIEGAWQRWLADYLANHRCS
ncbi:MAG: hypothetical protein JOZ39_12585 [Chloroflexi bacterium]|nr:hypothetical protein [Chloroflexota bacterium]